MSEAKSPTGLGCEGVREWRGSTWSPKPSCPSTTQSPSPDAASLVAAVPFPVSDAAIVVVCEVAGS